MILMNTEERIALCEDMISAVNKEIARLKEEVRQENRVCTRFEPKYDDLFVYVDRDGGTGQTGWQHDCYDKKMSEYNNVFRSRSRENISRYAYDILAVQNRLMQLHEELCPDYWSTYEKCLGRHIVKYDSELNMWIWVLDAYGGDGIPFTMNAAVKACNILNAEKFMMSVEVSECER